MMVIENELEGSVGVELSEVIGFCVRCSSWVCHRAQPYFYK